MNHPDPSPRVNAARRSVYLDGMGVFAGYGVPLLVRDPIGHWQARPQTDLERLFTIGTGKSLDLSLPMVKLAEVASALNRGDRSTAAIALAQSGLPMLDDDDAARAMAAADPLSTGAVRALERGYDVDIEYADGIIETRSGGSRAWRNNNPGNIRMSAEAISSGAIGNAGGFAVFPDEAAGKQAVRSLLESPAYASLTVDAAVARWAPPQENDTVRYAMLVRRWTNLAGTEVVEMLASEQIDAVVAAISRMEGRQVGAVKRTQSITV